MLVLEALLVKACGPLSFVLLVQWSHDNIQDEQKMIINILATLVIYACLSLLLRHTFGFKKNNSSLVAIIILDGWSGCTFTLNLCLVFYMFENEQQKKFITEHVVPFMDMLSIFRCIKHELWCVLNFAYRYARIVKISMIRCMTILIYLSVHAFVLVMLLDFIYTTCVATTHVFLTDHFLDPQRADLIRDYPSGYGHVIELDRDQNYPAFVTETFGLNENGTTTRMNLLKEIYKDSADTYLPYHNYSILRYIGEDAEFSCSYLLTNSSRFTTIWLKNGKQLANSNRYLFDSSTERDDIDEKGRRYIVKSKLRIHVINRFDFGKYECVSKISKRQNEQSLHEMVIETFTILVYNLSELQPEKKLFYRAVGNLVKSFPFFYYHSFQSDDVTLDYTINDRPVKEECKGYMSQACSLGSKLQRIFDSNDLNKVSDGALPIISTYYGETLNIYYALIEFCLCHDGIGIHRLSFRRYVYLKSKNTTKILEFQHPYTVIILPRTKLSLFRYFDDNVLYNNIETLIYEGKDLDIIQRKINELSDFISANEEKVFSIANFVQCCITIISLLIVNMLLRLSINFYIKWFIRIPVRRILYQPLAYQELQRLPIENKKYDIIISHTDDDYKFVVDVLVPYLEKECNLRICLPDRDFHQGQTIFKLYKDAFDASRKIIVVLSTKYLNDAMCGNMLLKYMILPLIFEERKEKKDVLFIKCDETSRLPEPLRWNFDVEVLSWTTEVQTILKLKKIRSWHFTGEL